MISFNHLEGMVHHLSPFLQSPSSLKTLNGANVSYQLGSILKDTGYVIVGSALQANKSITGLFNFRQSSSVQKMLATVDDSTSDDTQLFYSTGGAWTEIGAAETAWVNKAGITVDMESFIGYCFFVGHGSTDGFITPASLTNTTFSTATNVTSMPNAKYIKRYRDRLYIFNTDIAGTATPFRCYFSSVPSAGSITWTVASDFIDVDYSEAGTGLGAAWDRLLLFNEFSTYMYDQTNLKKIWDIGGYHRTIDNYGPYVIFGNNEGIWMSTGGQPANISDPIKKLYRAGTPSNYLGEIVNEEYRLYMGTVTAEGVTYSNCMAIFNFPTQSWRIREYAHSMTALAKYTASGVSHLWMGDTTGKVYEKGEYWDSTLLSSDNGSNITSQIEFAPIHLNTFVFEKDLTNLVFYAERAMGVKVYCRVIDNTSRAVTDYRPIGELKSFINKFPNISTENGVLLQLMLTETGSTPYYSIHGFELDAKPVSKNV